MLKVERKQKRNVRRLCESFLVPPKIIDELTTEPYPPSIRSGSNFTIKCYAHGRPTPKIRILSYDQYDNAKSKSLLLIVDQILSRKREISVKIILSN